MEVGWFCYRPFFQLVNQKSEFISLCDLTIKIFCFSSKLIKEREGVKDFKESSMARTKRGLSLLPIFHYLIGMVPME